MKLSRSKATFEMGYEIGHKVYHISQSFASHFLYLVWDFDCPLTYILNLASVSEATAVKLLPFIPLMVFCRDIVFCPEVLVFYLFKASAGLLENYLNSSESASYFGSGFSRALKGS